MTEMNIRGWIFFLCFFFVFGFLFCLTVNNWNRLKMAKETDFLRVSDGSEGTLERLLTRTTAGCYPVLPGVHNTQWNTRMMRLSARLAQADASKSRVWLLCAGYWWRLRQHHLYTAAFHNIDLVYKHASKCTYISHSRIRISIHMQFWNTDEHAYAQTQQHKHTHTDTCTGTCVFARAHTHTHTHVHTPTHAHMCTYTHTHARTHSCTRTNAHKHTHTYSHEWSSILPETSSHCFSLTHDTYMLLSISICFITFLVFYVHWRNKHKAKSKQLKMTWTMCIVSCSASLSITWKQINLHSSESQESLWKQKKVR